LKGCKGIHLGLLVAVQVDAIVLFHALHELFHENPVSNYKQLEMRNRGDMGKKR
jgi:hypothetical protein